MNDQETQEEANQEATSNGTKETISGSDEGLSLIEKAKVERVKMDEVAKALKIENDRFEKLKANEALGGITEGGQPSQPKEELSPAEYTKQVEEDMRAGKYND